MLVGVWTAPGKAAGGYFLDVGRVVHLLTPGGQNILLDGGGSSVSPEVLEQVGRLVVLPYLQHRRVRKLDLVIISPPEDHYGGLRRLEKVPVSFVNRRSGS